MASFVVRVETTDGRILQQRHDSGDAQSLRRSLEERGLFVLELKREGGLGGSLSGLGFLKKIKDKDLLVFNQELLVLLRAGLPIMKTLDTIIERTENKELLAVIQEVREEVRNGYSLSDAFGRFPHIFSPLYMASIKAGEQSGELPTVIKRYIDYMKRAQSAKEKVAGALIYPAILVTVAVGAVLFLLIYVVPTFSQVYLEAGQDLPVPTQILLGVTNFVRDQVIFLVGAIVAGLIVAGRFLRSEGGSRLRERFILGLPYLGDIVLKYAFTKLSQVLATLLNAGIPLVPSLRLALGSLANKILQDNMEQVIKGVEEGKKLSQALTESQVAPPMMIRLVSVGESTGSLPEMLTETANFYQEEIDHKVEILTHTFEPVIMVFMGLIVAAILVAMYLPIFNLAETMR